MTEDTSGGKSTKIIYKDARTGKIVSDEYAKQHPGRTYALTVPEDSEDTEVCDTLGDLTDQPPYDRGPKVWPESKETE
jgi:hypothetical protein